MKIPFNELKHYFGTGLEVQAETEGVLPLEGLVFENYFQFSLIHPDYEGAINIKNWKPIVRPMSDLVKEITIDGKVITPIFELYDLFVNKMAKKSLKSGNLLFTPLIRSDRKEVIVVEIMLDNFKGIRYEVISLFSFWHDNFSYGFSLKVNEKYQLIAGSQSRLIEQLFKWHFDVFGWLDKGLAVNYNEFHKQK